jgi:hypothetical protein
VKTVTDEAKQAAEDAAEWMRGEFMPIIVIGLALYLIASRRN